MGGGRLAGRWQAGEQDEIEVSKIGGGKNAGRQGARHMGGQNDR